MDNSLFLSIIIPVYNGEKYIGECLTSCLQQDLDCNKYEIIVIDDGSLDNSVNIIEQYIKNYTNVYLIKNEHKGVSVARNTGILNAKGQYVWFVDCDDLIKQNCLNYLYLNFNCGEYDKIQFKGYTFIGSTNQDLTEFKMNDDKNIIFYWGYACTSIQKKEICLKNNLFFNKNIAVGEDELFHLEYNIFMQTKAYELDKVLYFYRKHSNQVTNSAFSNPLFQSMEIMKGCQYLTEKLKADNRYCTVIEFVLKRLDYALRLLSNEEDQRKANKILKQYKKMGVLPCNVLYDYVDKNEVPNKNRYYRYYAMRYGDKREEFKDRLKHPFRSGINLIKKIINKK